MSGCCASKTDGDCALPQSAPGICPGCASKAKSVSTLTVKNLVRDHTKVFADSSYRFCRAPECEVVYFSDGAVFRKSDLKVRVGLKEQRDPIPLCYCFGFEERDLREEIRTGDQGIIPQRITALIKQGMCACQERNPSGACCLGDVTRALERLMKEAI